MNCQLCQEPILEGDRMAPVHPPMHTECGIREALGGIGHLLDHEYWCKTRHDPDAGLNYRDSARLVLSWVHQVGIERAAGSYEG